MTPVPGGEVIAAVQCLPPQSQPGDGEQDELAQAQRADAELQQSQGTSLQAPEELENYAAVWATRFPAGKVPPLSD